MEAEALVWYALGVRGSRFAHAFRNRVAEACGLAVISPLVDDDARISPPFPLSSGRWTTHGFQARFRPDALARPQVRRFREWLLDESAKTNAWLARNLDQRGVIDRRKRVARNP